MWKKCNINMLFTNEKAILNEYQICIDTEGYYKNKIVVINEPNLKRVRPQHLYITSDEEIKIGDWVIIPFKESAIGLKVFQVKEISRTGIAIFGTTYKGLIEFGCELKECKKIIVTTDTSLEIALIPQQFINYFIEQYNKGNVIKEVLVEYKDGKTCTICGSYQAKEYTSCKYPKGGNTCCGGELEFKILINSDNTINIKPIKDSWSREEVTQLLHKYENDMLYYGRDGYYKGCFPKVTDDWANENLY